MPDQARDAAAEHTAGVQIRLMMRDDVPLGLSLCRKAGWNQDATDWHRWLDLAPQGSLVAVLDDRAVGTTVAATLGGVGWIAMVLVEPDAQGRGVGRALLQHAIDYLDSYDIPTIRLDATEAGARLYVKLDFADDYELLRFTGRPAATGDEQAGGGGAAIELMTRDDLEEVIALDTAATGTDRRPFIEALFTETGEQWRICRRGGELRGYLAVRNGHNATQLGPCIAGDMDAAAALVGDALVRFAGEPVMVDVPAAHQPLRELLAARGLEAQRSFRRMTRGRRVDECVERIALSSGPELG